MAPLGIHPFSYAARLDRALGHAPVLAINDGSRIVIMSDCHRGSGNPADDFGKNQNACHAALKAYNRLEYTYIELGDGDELWENKSISDIQAVHGDIYRILRQYHADNRLWMLYGNHDMEKKLTPAIMATSFDAIRNVSEPLLPGIVIHGSMLIYYEPTSKAFLLVHGHQADFFNDVLWRVSRFLVRHVWQRLKLIGFNDPTSAAKNNRIMLKIERRLMQWARDAGMPVIAGHTHRPVLPDPADGKYLNSGSCVHPWNITAIEIASGRITLVKWGQKTRDDGTVYIGRDVIAGPRRLTEYLDA